MAIKGLSELLKKHKDGTIDDAQFEAELNKALPEDWIPKSKYNELSESKKLSDENLKKANATLEELKGKAGLSDEYKAQIDKLKEEAKKADVPFYKDSKLADTLSRLEIGEAIPPELYEVVAEILVFVDDMDKVKSKLQGAGKL